MDWQFLLLNPNGRIGPRDYWIGVAIIIGGNVLADVLPVLGGLLWLLLIWVGLCVYGKRLHDAGRTAALHAIPWAVNFVIMVLALMKLGGAILTAVMNGREIGLGLLLSAGGGLLSLGALSVLVWAGYTLWLGLALGDAGDNAYGPAPALDGEAVLRDPHPHGASDAPAHPPSDPTNPVNTGTDAGTDTGTATDTPR